jgi:DNA-directed RNA polymerase specialized sigma24 family protein
VSDIDRELAAAHAAVADAGNSLERLTERRAIAFALANEKGHSSGDIARLLGVTPMQALYIIRNGHRLIKQRREARQFRSAA